MEYRSAENGQNIEISISGRLTFDENVEFRSLIEEATGNEKKNIILDIRDIEFADSAGLGLLLRLDAMAKSKSCSVSLKVPSEGQVKKMLDVANFHQMISYAE